MIKMKILTPIKSIRAKCLDCCGYQSKEVRLCPAKNCPIYPYRMGKRPKKEEKSLDSSMIFENNDKLEAEV